MKIGNLLDILMSENNSEIVNLLNTSLYGVTYEPLKNGTIISTGVTFVNQNRKEFRLFYELKEEKLIFQVSRNDNNYPIVLGMVLNKAPHHDNYINTLIPYIIVGITNDHELTKGYGIESENIVKNILNHDRFFTCDIDSGDGTIKNVKEYPLEYKIPFLIGMSYKGFFFLGSTVD